MFTIDIWGSIIDIWFYFLFMYLFIYFLSGVEKVSRPLPFETFWPTVFPTNLDLEQCFIFSYQFLIFMSTLFKHNSIHNLENNFNGASISLSPLIVLSRFITVFFFLSKTDKINGRLAWFEARHFHWDLRFIVYQRGRLWNVTELSKVSPPDRLPRWHRYLSRL